MWLNRMSADAGSNRYVDCEIRPPLRILWEVNCPEDAILADGNTLVVAGPSELNGIGMRDGRRLWSFKGKRKEFDASFHTATAEAFFIHSQACFRSLAWNGHVRWERCAPKGSEDPGASCIAHGRHWGVRTLLVDTHDGNVIGDFQQAGKIVGFCGFSRGLIWYSAWPDSAATPYQQRQREIVGLDLATCKEAVRIGFEARSIADPVFTDDYVVCKVCLPNWQPQVMVWSAVDGRPLCRIPIACEGYFCVGGNSLFCFVSQDEHRNESKLACYDLQSGAQTWVHDLAFVNKQPPILTRDHIWFTGKREGTKQSTLIAVNCQTGETVWERPFPSYCWAIAAGNQLLTFTRRKACGLVAVSADLPR